MAMAPETSFLVQGLRKAIAGQLFAWDDLTEIVGTDIHKHRGKLSSAIEIVSRDYGIMFESVTRVGYRAISTNEIPLVTQVKSLRSIERTVDKWGARLEASDYGAMDKKGKERYLESATRRAIVQAASGKEAFLMVKERLKPTNRFKPCKEDVLRAIEYGVS